MRAFSFCVILISLLMAGGKNEAQEPPRSLQPTNFGLTAPQPSDELPHSHTPFTVPKKVAKGPVVTRLVPVGRAAWELTDGWEMTADEQVVMGRGSLFDTDYDTSTWYHAVVPGTVLTTLVDAGVYPDPYYGLDNLSIPDTLCRKTWWYRIRFAQPPHEGMSKAALCFDGINYRADIWLNGHLVGHIDGAFVRGAFDVTNLLNDTNVLAVKIYPPANPGIPHEQSKAAGRGPNGGQLCMDGPTFISSEGWDWIPGIRDRNIGIWQGVQLEYTGDVTLCDPQVITDLPLPDTSQADLTVRVKVANRASQMRRAVLRGQLEDCTLFTVPLMLEAGSTCEVCCTPDDYAALHMEWPRLWWPNGYGEQNLYTLRLNIEVDGQCADSREVRFGVREFSYELTVDTPNEEGVRIEFSPTNDLSHGEMPFDTFHRRLVADDTVIPALKEGVAVSRFKRLESDATAPYIVIRCNGVRIFCRGGNWGMDDGMKRVSRKRLEPAFRLHREAGFNMVRNWTGESTEELFYSLCDEYGMLVWNDFWLSTEGYNLNVNDEQLFMENARDVVRRFRNHPSLAVWCPRNEGYAPPSLENGLSDLLAREDGTRYYSPNSRYMNLRTSGPWHWLEEESEYTLRYAYGFTTEVGTPSVPTAETMCKFIPTADRWPISDTWYYHDLHFGLPEYVKAVDERYGTANSIEDFCRKAQMLNYDSHRAMLEAWNSRMWCGTSGVLLWMSHPAWPSLEWQIYSWDFETHGSYYGCRKACEPLHVQMSPHDDRMIVVNTTQTDYDDAAVEVSSWTLDGKCLVRRRMAVGRVKANGVTEVGTADFTEVDMCRIVRLELFVGTRRVSLNDYLCSPHHDFHILDDMASPRLYARKIASDRFAVTNRSRAVALSVKFNIRDAATEEAVLPAYISEGYIHLLPGETRVVEVDFQSDAKVIVSAEGYNFARQTLLVW